MNDIDWRHTFNIITYNQLFKYTDFAQYAFSNHNLFIYVISCQTENSGTLDKYFEKKSITTNNF